jgi:hypothetical protein
MIIVCMPECNFWSCLFNGHLLCFIIAATKQQAERRRTELAELDSGHLHNLGLSRK